MKYLVICEQGVDTHIDYIWIPVMVCSDKTEARTVKNELEDIQTEIKNKCKTLEKWLGHSLNVNQEEWAINLAGKYSIELFSCDNYLAPTYRICEVPDSFAEILRLKADLEKNK
jgi:hypothetical protein